MLDVPTPPGLSLRNNSFPLRGRIKVPGEGRVSSAILPKEGILEMSDRQNSDFSALASKWHRNTSSGSGGQIGAADMSL